MSPTLLDYLATLLAETTAADGEWAFYYGAKKHPEWRPFLTRVAQERVRVLRLRPIWEIEDLIPMGGMHIARQAWISIKDPLRPRGGLRLDPSRGERWNWGVLTRTAKQGMRRDYRIRKHCEVSELAEALDTISVHTDDPRDLAVLVLLVDRRWIRPLKRSLCLRDKSTILEGGRQLGLHPSQVVAGTVERLRRRLSTSESVDRSWMKRVMSYVDRPWTY